MQEDASVKALFDPGSADDFFTSPVLDTFDPQASTEHSPRNALWLAEFCRLVYRDQRSQPTTRESFIRGRGWSEVAFFDQDGTQGGLYVHDERGGAVLAFRGTSQLVDAFVDFLALLTQWEGKGRVHLGFHNALDHVWSAVRAALRDVPHPVFFAGHSLGAALATLSAARCLNDPTMRSPAALYTIGSPRVGNAAFVASLRGLHHSRIVNDADIVPQVPPVVPFSPGLLYQHGGELHHIHADSHIEVHALDTDVRGTLWDLVAARERVMRTAQDLKAVLRGEWKGDLPEPLSDHAPINYVARLEKAVAAAT